jgi:hypothetical protein
MRTQSHDTHPEMEDVHIALIRQASIAKRIAITRSWSQRIIRLSRRAMMKANPEWTLEKRKETILAYNYGITVIEQFPHNGETMNAPDLLATMIPLIDAFEKIGVSYSIGGSVASSAYGIPRATLDVDIVSDLKIHQVPLLVTLLESSYYRDEEMMIRAIRDSTSFNLIHLETLMKIDVFIVKDEDYPKESFRRRRKEELEEIEGAARYYLLSPEDIILSKLEWYRLGNYVSQQQWNDIMGVLKVQHRMLDMEYLRKWASELGLSSLLEQAIRDADME